MKKTARSEKNPARETTSTVLSPLFRLEAPNQIYNITIYNAIWEIVKAAIVDYIARPKYAL